MRRNHIADPIHTLKNDLDTGDFNPHVFRSSLHDRIWELVNSIKLTPEEEGLTQEQEASLYAIDGFVCGNLRIDKEEYPSPDYWNAQLGCDQMSTSVYFIVKIRT